MIKNILFSIVIIYAGVLSFIMFKDYTDSQNVVVRINNSQEIKQEEVLRNLENEYWKPVVGKLVDEKLIDLEVKKQKLANPTSKELKRESELSFRLRGGNLDPNSKSDRDYLENNIAIKKLAIKYTVEDEELKDYFNSQDTIGDKKYVVNLYTKNKPFLDDLAKDINNHVSIQTVEEKYGVKFTKSTFSSNDLFFRELETLEEGHAIHVEEEDKHAVIQLIEVQATKLSSVDEDREKVIEAYLTDKFHKEKVDLINYLRANYLVEISNR